MSNDQGRAQRTSLNGGHGFIIISTLLKKSFESLE